MHYYGVKHTAFCIFLKNYSYTLKRLSTCLVKCRHRIRTVNHKPDSFWVQCLVRVRRVLSGQNSKTFEYISRTKLHNSRTFLNGDKLNFWRPEYRLLSIPRLSEFCRTTSCFIGCLFYASAVILTAAYLGQELLVASPVYLLTTHLEILSSRLRLLVSAIVFHSPRHKESLQGSYSNKEIQFQYIPGWIAVLEQRHDLVTFSCFYLNIAQK